MCDLSNRLSSCKINTGRRPSTLSLGSCGSSRSSLSPSSISSGRSLASPTSNTSSIYSSRSSLRVETRRTTTTSRTFVETNAKKNVGLSSSRKINESSRKINESSRKINESSRKISESSRNISERKTAAPKPPSGRLLSPSSLLSQEEIKSRIGNRATKTVKPEKKCVKCLRGIEEEGVFALGKLYHKQCLRCGYCGTRIESKFFTRNNKPCCPKCSKGTTEKCKVCELDIQGDSVEVGQDLFHPTCMRCYICDTLSKDSFFTHKGLPVCKEHSLQLIPDCNRCGNKVVDSGFTKGDEIICSICFEAEEIEICGKCGKDIKGEVLAINNIKFHKKCLCCVICRDNMVGKPVTMDKENNVYCSKDYDRKFCLTCHGCKKPIVPKQGQTKASRLRAMDKDFHIACFKCQDCGCKLEGGGSPGKPCYPYLSLFLCRNCMEKRECESE